MSWRQTHELARRLEHDELRLPTVPKVGARTAVAVFAWFVSFADTDGRTDVPLTTIAALCGGIHRNTVRRIARGLEASGHLVVVKERTGRPTVYRVDLDGDPEPSEGAGSEDENTPNPEPSEGAGYPAHGNGQNGQNARGPRTLRGRASTTPGGGGGGGPLVGPPPAAPSWSPTTEETSTGPSGRASDSVSEPDRRRASRVVEAINDTDTLPKKLRRTDPDLTAEVVRLLEAGWTDDDLIEEATADPPRDPGSITRVICARFAKLTDPPPESVAATRARLLAEREEREAEAAAKEQERRRQEQERRQAEREAERQAALARVADDPPDPDLVQAVTDWLKQHGKQDHTVGSSINGPDIKCQSHDDALEVGRSFTNGAPGEDVTGSDVQAMAERLRITRCTCRRGPLPRLVRPSDAALHTLADWFDDLHRNREFEIVNDAAYAIGHERYDAIKARTASPSMVAEAVELIDALGLPVPTRGGTR